MIDIVGVWVLRIIYSIGIVFALWYIIFLLKEIYRFFRNKICGK